MTTKRPKYKYRVVTHCGYGVWGPPGSLKQARILVTQLRKGITIPTVFKEVEIQRVLQVGHSGQMYWLWRRGKWRMDHDSLFSPTTRDLKKWDS